MTGGTRGNGANPRTAQWRSALRGALPAYLFYWEPQPGSGKVTYVPSGGVAGA
jgi:hypothetical protein